MGPVAWLARPVFTGWPWNSARRVIAPPVVICMIWFWLPSLTRKVPSRTIMAYGLPPTSMSCCWPLETSSTGLSMLNLPMLATSVVEPSLLTLYRPVGVLGTP